MHRKCQYCEYPAELVLKETANCKLVIPTQNHIHPDDGGHLMVIVKRHINSRKDATDYEMNEMWRLSILASSLLKEVLNVDWFNYQENGNWNVEYPSLNHFHLHIYGRSKKSVNQQYGESLILPKRSDIPLLQLNDYSLDQLEELKLKANKFQ